MTAIILRRRKLGRGSAKGITAVSTTGITQVRNWIDKIPEGVDLVFRWGCTSNVGVEGIGHQYDIVNTAKAIHWCSDKRQGRLDMQAAGVPVPETWTTENFRRALNNHADGFRVSEDQSFVARPARHAQGKNLRSGTGTWLCISAVDQLFEGGYVSRMIDKVAEYRVFVCQNRVVWVARKTPGNPNDVAWNVAQGGRFDNVGWDAWPKAVIQAALAACKVGELDFGGVDVMVDAEGNPYVLEVNSAPSQTSPYRQSCVAKAFDYIVNNGKAHFEDVPDSPRRTYKSYIHPALWKKGDINEQGIPQA